LIAQLADQDNNGFLTYEEFLELMKYLNLPLSNNVALRIFSEAKKADSTMGPDE
jgi:Ca2+-binding EF-hand superfamily protein